MSGWMCSRQAPFPAMSADHLALTKRRSPHIHGGTTVTAPPYDTHCLLCERQVVGWLPGIGYRTPRNADSIVAVLRSSIAQWGQARNLFTLWYDPPRTAHLLFASSTLTLEGCCLMKLGLGLYPRLLTPENFRFARQVGATHIVAHLPDWSASGQRQVPAGQELQSPIWSYEELRHLRSTINSEGLELAAIENFEPGHWYDVLLDGPKKTEQMDGLKQIIRNMGKAGIPVMGYNFSMAGVWGRTTGPWARGGALSVGYVEEQAPPHDPIPNGTIWNMVYDRNAPAGDIGTVSSEQLWSRFGYFLKELVPVAEEANVRLALHPDDPPLESVRQTARLVYRPELYQRVIDTVPSYHNALEFCQGTIAEMHGDMNIYEAVDRYAGQDRIAYVHFRNVKGKVPNYHEVFVDEGDIDMIRTLRLYKKHGYDGVCIPDHTPGLECGAPWHAGMAYALGYMRAAIRMIESE